jgi:hypothetical protein
MNFSKVLWQSKVAAQKSLSLATTIPLEWFTSWLSCEPI